MRPARSCRRLLWLAATLALAAGPAAAGGAVTQARVGVAFEVRLEGNPGTGYRWQYDPAASEHPERVAVTEEGYREPDSPMPGAPAEFAFTVMPLAAGTAVLAFRYQRPWEAEAIETAMHRVSIAP